MRPASFVALSCASLIACSEPDTEAVQSAVAWLEWPAEVRAATAFTARMVVTRPCGPTEAFRSEPTVDQSAVTFEPYFLVKRNGEILCIAETQTLIVFNLDTVAPVPGLPADFSRVYEMRGATYDVYAPSTGLVESSLPVRTFGDVIVRTVPVTAARANAAGSAWVQRDTAGCLRLRPAGLYAPDGYPVENPPDTASNWAAFVRGYLYEPPAPVCGETRAFHLVSRN